MQLVKLRLLTDRNVGICDQLDEFGVEVAGLRDIRRVVERELNSRPATGRSAVR